eukprot:SAG11_NODE_2429_length_3371_cov_5.133863_2_plen_165_part_00
MRWRGHSNVSIRPMFKTTTDYHPPCTSSYQYHCSSSTLTLRRSRTAGPSGTALAPALRHRRHSAATVSSPATRRQGTPHWCLEHRGCGARLQRPTTARRDRPPPAQPAPTSTPSAGKRPEILGAPWPRQPRPPPPRQAHRTPTAPAPRCRTTPLPEHGGLTSGA